MTCYQPSSPEPGDTLLTYAEAETACSKKGARLFQPRSKASLDFFRAGATGHVAGAMFPYALSTTRQAIGLTYQQPGEDEEDGKLFFG